jgi:hypothetical protein
MSGKSRFVTGAYSMAAYTGALDPVASQSTSRQESGLVGSNSYVIMTIWLDGHKTEQLIQGIQNPDMTQLLRQRRGFH